MCIQSLTIDLFYWGIEQYWYHDHLRLNLWLLDCIEAKVSIKLLLLNRIQMIQRDKDHYV